MEEIRLSPSFFQPQMKEEKEINTPIEAQQDFAKMLTNAIDQLNQAQIDSDTMTQKLVNHEINDLHEVMIAAEKASVTMQVTLEIRNKAIEAYQEIMRMQL